MRQSRHSPVTRGLIAWFVVTVGGSVALCVWLMGINNQLPTFGSKYEVNTVLSTVAALSKDSKVTMSGVTVGKVGAIKRKGVGAEVTLRITDERVTPIPADSRIALRMRTPLSENYFEISPGASRSRLPSGSTVPVNQTNQYVDVDEILSTLQGTTRIRARKLLQGVGGAVDGRGEDLNRLIAGAAGTVSDGSRFMRTAARNRKAVRRVVLQLANVTGAVGERYEAIEEVGTQGLAALRAVAGRDRALRSTLNELPSTLGQVRATTQTLDSVSRTATPVVRNVQGALHDLRPAVKRLRPATRIGRDVVSQLGAAAPGLASTLRRVRSLSGPTAAALPQVTKALCQLNPIVRYARPYTDDIIQTIVGLFSGSNSYDALGHTLRMAPTLNDSSIVGAPPEVNRAAHTLLHTGLFAKTRGSLTWDPYPPPGQIGKSSAAGRKLLMGPKDLAASGYKYPRTHADC